MVFKTFHTLLVVFTLLLGSSLPIVAIAKAACELKQLLTGEEFESLQRKWNKNHLVLPAAQNLYGQITTADEIYFYDTKLLTFKNDAILRWKKSDKSFTIKDRSGYPEALNLSGAECQKDYISLTSNKMSCQFDKIKSTGPHPIDLQLSDQQKEFLQSKNLKWDTSQLVQMGPIRSYKTDVDASVCGGLGNKGKIDLESWIMENGDRSEMVYEASIKVKDTDDCDKRNEAFRLCIGKARGDDKAISGTKTEAVYEFYQPEKL